MAGSEEGILAVLCIVCLVWVLEYRQSKEFWRKMRGEKKIHRESQFRKWVNRIKK